MADCTQRSRSGRRFRGKTVVGSTDCGVAGDGEDAGDADGDCSANEGAAPGWNLGCGLNWGALK